MPGTGVWGPGAYRKSAQTTVDPAAIPSSAKHIASRRIGQAVDCLQAQTCRVGPQHQYVATEGCDIVRTTLLTWSQKPTVQATDTVQKVSHSQEPVRPTPLRLAYDSRPREFGSRAALRGRATLAVVRLLSLHQPSLAYSPNIRVGQRSCHPIAPCIAEWRSTSRKRSTVQKVPFTALPCHIVLRATFSFVIVGISPTISHHHPPHASQ